MKCGSNLILCIKFSVDRSTSFNQSARKYRRCIRVKRVSLFIHPLPHSHVCCVENVFGMSVFIPFAENCENGCLLVYMYLKVQLQETEEEKSKEQEVKDFFATIAGEDLEVDCYELQEILNFALKKGIFNNFCILTTISLNLKPISINYSSFLLIPTIFNEYFKFKLKF